MSEARVGLAAAIFAASILLILLRPRHLNEGVAAGAGAALMVVSGLVTPHAALGALLSEWNLFAFFLGMMLLAGLADAAGLFDGAGVLAAAAGGGNGRRLLFGVFAAGALITTFLSNDATALILTPVVWAMTERLGLPPVPYLFATTFAADTASMTLPISNPINIVIVERMGLRLQPYVDHLLAVSAVALAVNALVFAFAFRHQLARAYVLNWRAELGRAVPRPGLAVSVGLGLVGVVAAYLVGFTLGWPVGLVALGGAAGVGMLAAVQPGFSARKASSHVAWSLFLYVAGLFILVRGLADIGLAAALGSTVGALAHAPLSAALSGLVGGAVGANVINNFPATLILLTAIGGGHLAAHLHLPYSLGVLVGADLGPNLTPVGSLSTMLWLLIVRRRGLEVSRLDYLKLGAATTPLMLAGAFAALALGLR